MVMKMGIFKFSFLFFQCKWCPVAKLCSDGFDRSKQKWLKFNCDKPHKSYSINEATGSITEMCSNDNRNFNGSPHDYDPSFTTVDDDHLHNHVEDFNTNDQEHFTDSKSSKYFDLVDAAEGHIRWSFYSAPRQMGVRRTLFNVNMTGGVLVKSPSTEVFYGTLHRQDTELVPRNT